MHSNGKMNKKRKKNKNTLSSSALLPTLKSIPIVAHWPTELCGFQSEYFCCWRCTGLCFVCQVVCDYASSTPSPTSSKTIIIIFPKMMMMIMDVSSLVKRKARHWRNVNPNQWPPSSHILSPLLMVWGWHNLYMQRGMGTHISKRLEVIIGIKFFGKHFLTTFAITLDQTQR